MNVKYSKTKAVSDAVELKDAALLSAAPPSPEKMVRTQLYFTQAECDFLRQEAKRREETVAGVLRSYVEERMAVPDEVWANNPLLEPTPADPAFRGHEDSSINHDHYLYGCPKKYSRVRGRWVPAPLGNE